MLGLTEVDGEVVDLLDHGLEHGPRDELDVALHLHLDQPVQHLLLRGDVPLEHVRHRPVVQSMSDGMRHISATIYNNQPVEEDESGHLLDAVLGGEVAVGRLDEVDVLPVGVVVDVLQRLQHGQARRAILLLVWIGETLLSW